MRSPRSAFGHHDRPSLAEELRRATGDNPARCYQCGKCSAGCPMAVETTLRPHDVMRLVNLDRRESAARRASRSGSASPARPAPRAARTAAIPARMIDALREMASPSPERAPRADRARSTARSSTRCRRTRPDVRARPGGRSTSCAPATLLARRARRRRACSRAASSSFVPHAIKGVARRPPHLRGLRAQRRGRGRTERMKLGYYPGCSLHATAREFDESLRAIAGRARRRAGRDRRLVVLRRHLGARHQPPALRGARRRATSPSPRSRGYEEVLAPCAACFNRLAVGPPRDPGRTRRSPAGCPAILGRPFANTVAVRNIVELLPRARSRRSREKSADAARRA